jgi:signal transduction histidine kinase
VASASQPAPSSRLTPARPGLRLQILLALAGVILVAYVPLFFAIAQVTRVNALAYREESARALGRAAAAHVGDVMQTDPALLGRVTAAHVGGSGALAIVVFDAAGKRLASSGPDAEIAAIAVPSLPYGESVQRTATHTGARALDVVMPAGDAAVLVRVATDEDSARTAGLVRGIALYMGVFALMLLVLTYFVLTRAIVRPIEQLSAAADRVARGARDLELPRAGAREVSDLGTSVRAMAARLLADERAMRAKVDELQSTTRRLGETREQLAGSERLASVGKLAAGVAHEIGNPIAAIMGMHDLIAEGDLPAEDQADFLRRMRKETERIHVVVRDLLDYARPETGPSSARIAIATVKEVVDDTLSLVKPQKEMRNVTVSTEIDPDLRVMLSPQRLTQVLLNLLLNAAGALAGKPSDAPHTLAIRAKADGDARVRIEVEDDGPGIPAELRDRVFDPFVTTKEVGSGTGLGLSVCRGIVEGAKGRIELDATYASGARFVIELPRA